MARKTNTRQTRDEFIILTNGKGTEKNYFELLISYKSVYKVKVIFYGGDPIRLVEQATSYISTANQVWVVFDIDNTYEENTFVPAITLARKNGIKYAISNLAFEVWLISHFEKCSKEMTTEGHIKAINKYLQDTGYKGKYDKTDKELLKKYFIKDYRIAVENSKAVYQTRKRDHEAQCGDKVMPRYWEWNSFTSVFKLVEALKLKKEEEDEEERRYE